MTKRQFFETFTQFIQKCPSPWHVVKELEDTFRQEGFQPLKETVRWKLKKGGKYYVSRGGSLFAFILPKSLPSKYLFAISHTDSPTFKLKPHPEKVIGGELALGLEIYGAPLLNSWLNRPLGLAGIVALEDGKQSLFIQDSEPLVLAQLAIHLDRKVNEEGIVLKKHDHLFALTGEKSKEKGLLDYWIREIIGKPALAHDLFLFPLDPPSIVGPKSEPHLLSPRLDNLSSVFAAATALKKSTSKDALLGAFFFNHEEIGSESREGAASHFATSQIRRIADQLGMSQEEHEIAAQSGITLSLDAAHGFHPLYADRYDEPAPRLGRGPVVKTHAGLRYASSAAGISSLKNLGIPLQTGSSRGDMPCGTTVGPIFEARTGMRTVDLGIPILSMHSSYEIASLNDELDLTDLLKKFY